MMEDVEVESISAFVIGDRKTADMRPKAHAEQSWIYSGTIVEKASLI
jgi:hypothetical protein